MGKKNPLLQKKWNEGFQAGRKQGIADSVDYFSEKFVMLEDVPGIGKKTMEKIAAHFNEPYLNLKYKEKDDKK